MKLGSVDFFRNLLGLRQSRQPPRRRGGTYWVCLCDCGRRKRRMALRPMSCPCHVQVFNKGLRSWRELSVRYAEFGVCHRNEPSGSPLV